MKTRGWMIENGGWQARSVLECGDTSPLSSTRRVASSPKRGHVRALQKLAGIGVALFCFFTLHSAFCLRASGQGYSINWHKIAGGGGTSSNGEYTISGTIGQPDAGGPMTGGNYSITSGFWALISVVQTPGAPTLHISHTGNTVKVYWQAISGWNLQGNSDLSTTNWVTPSETVNNDGTNNFIIVNPSMDNEFYRLFKP